MNKTFTQNIKFSRLFFRDATVILAFALFVGALAIGDSPISDALSYLIIALLMLSVLFQLWVTVKPRRS